MINTTEASLGDLFPDGKLLSELKELDMAVTELKKRRPVIGFEPNFYVPGWIGMVQSHLVERKMWKFNGSDFYGGKGYWSFATWVLNMAVSVSANVSKLKESGESLSAEQCKAIVGIFHELISTWVDCCPEMATWRYECRDYCELQRVKWGVAKYLKDCGYPQDDENEEDYGQGLSASLKAQGLNIVGMMINLAILAIIVGIISAIIK